MVRALCRDPDLAPRTIRNIYGIAHTMFRDAKIDDVIIANPCELKRGELPGKTDKDPEWRNAATYTLKEVRTLILDKRVPPERRVQYALKALAGLRHGEVAGLRWRHYEADVDPLGRLLIATSYDTGRTKTEVTRRVPVHPALSKLLASWRSRGWALAYGRKPKATDLLVPTRNQTTVDANDAVRAFVYDLAKLELRVDAGRHRNRGGHDLRAWFITSCQEAGAHRDLLRVITHTSKGDVMGGYTRATWPSLCAEVAKLVVGRVP
jgi:integrase